ncbi:hypothetical protein [Paraburkholderia aromaticivorans]|uniref:Uncharacterized protein n=1 Tax=Paraburkholderia aromaticivorans TaxID=2026199 RepID=A0A248VY09_9BURK|nr:hypothetical protein [Paraburkholderia aromaticivorans]ASW03857.1 hypothetical protein CJU94_37430 [Paraburkholderia aromaticivorans]
MTESKNTPRKPRHLPDPNFVSTTVDQWGGRLVECRDLWDGYSLDDAVLDSTPLKKCQWATLFAYMHRRFGPTMPPASQPDPGRNWFFNPNGMVNTNG